MKSALRIAAILLLLTLCTTGGVVLGAVSWLGRDLPSTDRLERISPAVKTQVFDVHNEVIGEFYKENRTIVPLAQVPRHLTSAFIAVEDRRFYKHWGVDVFRVGKAAVKDIAAGAPAEGGGTITQQLARNLFLTHEKTISRKVKETILALQIERRYSKNEILAMYENQIYFGEGAYGVQAAARTFFGKDVQQLTLPECALLAGLPRNPAGYDPRRYPEIALRRRQIVLRAMLSTKSITRAQFAAASAAPLGVTAGRAARLAPYFLEMVRQYLDARYGPNQVYEGGLRVYTTLDLGLQRIAEDALERHLSAVEVQKRYPARFRGPRPRVSLTNAMPYVEGAMIALDPRTGAVRVMVGGRDFADSPFNRVLQARRQTGSLWKPFVYVAAIDNGYHPNDRVEDSPFQLPGGTAGGTWAPQNYDKRFRGPVTLRYALQHSINIPAVRVAQAVGPGLVASYARRLGITSPIVTDLSMALGTSEMTLYEMTTAYATLANDGVRPTPMAVLKVLDRSGRTLETTKPRLDEVLPPATAATMTSMLQSVLDGGTAYSARLSGFKLPAAGKTGTTNDYTDAWFVGYTPSLVAGVWVGFDRKYTLGSGMTGNRAALPVWTAFMLQATRGQRAEEFPHLAMVTTRIICPVSGLLARTGCPDVYTETFAAGEEPTTLCDVHGGDALDQGAAPTPGRQPFADDEVETIASPAEADTLEAAPSPQ